MGEIADMMLEGILDEETGEYIGDTNLEDYGTEAPGFPRSLERERRTGKKVHEEGYHDVTIKLKAPKYPCPVCGKKVKLAGLSDHCKTMHKELL